MKELMGIVGERISSDEKECIGLTDEIQKLLVDRTLSVVGPAVSGLFEDSLRAIGNKKIQKAFLN